MYYPLSGCSCPGSPFSSPVPDSPVNGTVHGISVITSIVSVKSGTGTRPVPVLSPRVLLRRLPGGLVPGIP